MEIDELADNFVWLSIGHRLPNTNQYQLIRPKQSKSSLVLRDAVNKLEIAMPKTDCFKQSISYSGAVLWNKLSTNERKAARLFSPSS